jgi:hypothetical protein
MPSNLAEGLILRLERPHQLLNLRQLLHAVSRIKQQGHETEKCKRLGFYGHHRTILMMKTIFFGQYAFVALP